MKKLVAGGLAAALLVGSTLAGAAEPLRVSRGSANVGEAEGAVSTLLVVALFAIIGTATIAAVQSGNNDTPTSA